MLELKIHVLNHLSNGAADHFAAPFTNDIVHNAINNGLVSYSRRL
jgi:hypothetical protein